MIGDDQANSGSYAVPPQLDAQYAHQVRRPALIQALPVCVSTNREDQRNGQRTAQHMQGGADQAEYGPDLRQCETRVEPSPERMRTRSPGLKSSSASWVTAT